MWGLALAFAFNLSPADRGVVWPGDRVRVEEIRAHGGQAEWDSFLRAVGALNACPDYEGVMLREGGKTWRTVCHEECDQY